MGRKLHPGKLQGGLINLKVKLTLRSIFKTRSVDHKTVQRIELSMDLYGHLYPPQSLVRGRLRLLVAA